MKTILSCYKVNVKIRKYFEGFEMFQVNDVSSSDLMNKNILNMQHNLLFNIKVVVHLHVFQFLIKNYEKFTLKFSAYFTITN